MKAILTFIAVIAIAGYSNAQDFAKAMATAKTSYSAGKLEETHFALQQAMQEVDLVVGREVLKLLPPKLDAMETVAKDDNVTSNIGYIGATIHRAYGKDNRKADISIISNSPLVAMTNTILNTPMLGGMMNDGKTKTVKVQGYKARLERQAGSTADKNDYELQIPLGSAMITFKVDDCTDTQILAFADTIPLQKIAKLIE
ncbi:MAG TPA: hypothetical protein VJ844_12540 [Mucilaginibacter sp.]|nr:hypothetical protein [Mucilaginibacter sp.]